MTSDLDEIGAASAGANPGMHDLGWYWRPVDNRRRYAAFNGIIGEATAAEPSGLTFLQISDSHVGFDKPANPNARGTLEEAVNKIKSFP